MLDKNEKENKYITRVGTLEEALSLTEKWKEEGKFDLFRGQALNWPVVSTRYRIKEKDFGKHEEKFLRFLEFFSDNGELKHHITSVDEIYAIAQHYDHKLHRFFKRPQSCSLFCDKLQCKHPRSGFLYYMFEFNSL